MAMFGKEEPTRLEVRGTSPVEIPLSIIASGMRIIGDVETAGVLKVDGRIDGSVNGARQVLLGRGASIHGAILADEVVIGGVVDGGILATERLELQATAIVNGDIETKSIIVLEGARINGIVKMSDASAPRGGEPKVKLTGESLRLASG
jgi:Integral membrane protein CcmA involved in cell shape determination